MLDLCLCFSTSQDVIRLSHSLLLCSCYWWDCQLHPLIDHTFLPVPVDSVEQLPEFKQCCRQSWGHDSSQHEDHQGSTGAGLQRWRGRRFWNRRGEKWCHLLSDLPGICHTGGSVGCKYMFILEGKRHWAAPPPSPPANWWQPPPPPTPHFEPYKVKIVFFRCCLPRQCPQAGLLTWSPGLTQ